MRFIAFLIFLLFCLYAFVARWYFVCSIRQRCYGVEELDLRLQTLQMTDGRTVVLDNYEQFLFPQNAAAPVLNDNNDQFIDAAANYLQQEDNKNLTITAFYREQEADVTKGYFENLGIARAAEVRSLLVTHGVEEARISVDYGISEDDELKQPLLFELYTPGDSPSAYEKVQFTFRNMTFSDANYEFDSDIFNPGAPFLLYADSVQTFMQQNPNIKLTIIGHTDNVGTDEYNEDLGQRRSANAKKYFVDQLGLKNNTISVQSAGEKRPVAPNSTAENRQKNRRVNFVLQ